MFALTNFRLAVAAATLLLVQPALASQAGGPKAGLAKPARAAQRPLAAVAHPAPAALAAPAGVATPSAPQLVTLTGVVLRADGTPCAGAAVFVAGAPRQLVVTDAKGAFALPVPAGAALSLQADLFGEGSSRVAVPAPSAQPVQLILGQ